MDEADVADAIHSNVPMSASAPHPGLAPAPAPPPARTDIDWQTPFEGMPPSRKDLFIEGADLVAIHDLAGGLQAVTLRADGRAWTFRARITHGRDTPPGPARYLWISPRDVRIVPVGPEPTS